MEEPFDRRTVLLSALWSGLGQLASGQTNRGLVLLVLGTLSGTLGGVTGMLLRVLTLGRLKILPAKLNRLALVWLGVYLYNLYDAYNLATGAEDDEDLFEYEEYEPQASGDTLSPTAGSIIAQAKDTVAPVVDQVKATAANVVDTAGEAVTPVLDQAKDTVTPVVDQAKDAVALVVDRAKDTAARVAASAGDAVGPMVDQAKEVVATATDQGGETAGPGDETAGSADGAAATDMPYVPNIAGHTPDIFPASSASAADVAEAGAGGTPEAAGSDLANIGNAVADLDQAASQLAAGDQAVGQGRVEANVGPVGAVAPPRESVTGVPPATTAGAHSTAEANRVFDFSTLGFPWEEGITKAQLLDLLGDDPQVLGVFGQYLPADRVFHTEEEVLTLIPVQAWQDAQGRTWTGGELPNSDQPSAYSDSAAGRLPPGDTSTGTVQ